MIAMPTTTITVLRGEGTDNYGDDAPTKVPILKNIPASIIERRMRTFDADTQTPRFVNYYVMRVDSSTKLIAGDTIYDERTQVTYLVEDFNINANPTYGQDLKVNIKLTN